jgi:hypothetical protein
VRILTITRQITPIFFIEKEEVKKQQEHTYIQREIKIGLLKTILYSANIPL